MYETADVEEAIITLTKLKTREQTSKLDAEFLRSLDLAYKDEDLYEDESEDDINLCSIGTNEGWMEKEMLKVKNLDNLIREMSHKVKVTIFSLCKGEIYTALYTAVSVKILNRTVESKREHFILSMRESKKTQKHFIIVRIRNG